MNLDQIPLYDHHCHALKRDAGLLGLREFRRFFTESPDPRALEQVPLTLFYQRALRDLCAKAGCDVKEEAYLEYRAGRPLENHFRSLISASNIETMLVDTGLKADENLSLDEVRQLVPSDVREVLRLEALAERLIQQCSRFSEVEEHFRETIRLARHNGVLSLKSIAAYRGGLRIQLRERQAAEAAFGTLREKWKRERSIRLDDRPIIDYLLLAAFEEAVSPDLPIQFHTGFGDPDLDLREANPLHLRPVLEDVRFRRAPIVLLHCWPYVREAGYLANVYGNVYVDLSLTIPFAAHGGAAAILEALELAPASKVLLSTDAFSIPEIFYVAALGCRRSLESALEKLIETDWLTPDQADRTARMLLHDNAEALYGRIRKQ